MSCRARILSSNGRDVPPELLDLPVGRYVIMPMDEDAPALSREEEAGIEAALESYRQGRLIDAECAREIIDTSFHR